MNFLTLELQLKAQIKGVPNDGRMVARALCAQAPTIYAGYKRLQFEEGNAIIIISGSLDNSYFLFGYKETQSTMTRSDDNVTVQAIESTTLKPQFEIYPKGNRQYTLKDWDDLGSDDSRLVLNTNPDDDDLRLDSSGKVLMAGEVPIQKELYLAIKDFNWEDKEPRLTKDEIRLLSFRRGEILITTLSPNSSGWFEAYRHNDPDCICGIAHKNAVRKILFM